MKKMTEKEKTIQNYMKKLDLSREEAEQMWQDEQEDNLPELTAEQKAVEKEMLRADRKVESTPRKRERKPDENKRLLINALMDCLLEANPDEMEDVSILNPEREIEFRYCGERYRLTLSKPRKEKSA
jgi:predicted RNA-binding protein Jag